MNIYSTENRNLIKIEDTDCFLTFVTRDTFICWLYKLKSTGLDRIDERGLAPTASEGSARSSTCQVSF